jgi:hypothetical protein
MAGPQLFSLKKTQPVKHQTIQGLLENQWFDDFPFKTAQPVHTLIIFVALWKLNIAIIMNIGKLC